MRMPVLLLVDASDAMREVAMGISMAPAEGLPAGLEFDSDFTPVPLSLTDGETLTADVTSTDNAASFVVRGFIDASPDDPPTEVDGVPVYADPEIEEFLTCGGDAPVGTWEDVASLLAVSDLAARGLDGTNVALCIADTGINLQHLTDKLGWTPNLDSANSWTPKGSSTNPGEFSVGHGTMCAFDALIAAPNATLVDLPVLRAGGGGGSTMSGFLSAALSAYSQVMISWGVAGTGSGLDQYAAVVLSNSWGIFHPNMDFPSGHPGRYCDNPKHPFNLILETVSRSGIDVIFAAGNCGADCPDGRCKGRTDECIMGASASVDAFSVAGCDTNKERVGYSSQGPAITGMYGMKPDITGYTHFLGSEAFGPGSADSGTSAACPVVAGCIAAFRTKVDPRSPVTPYMLWSHIRDHAVQGGGQPSGWNADYGYGIIEPIAVADQLGLQP
jgi:hypothetical protein